MTQTRKFTITPITPVIMSIYWSEVRDSDGTEDTVGSSIFRTVSLPLDTLAWTVRDCPAKLAVTAYVPAGTKKVA
jgi:hypothetical protein